MNKAFLKKILALTLVFALALGTGIGAAAADEESGSVVETPDGAEIDPPVDDGSVVGTPDDETDAPDAVEPEVEAPSAWAAADVAAAIELALVPEGLQSAYTQKITRAEFCALAVALLEKNSGTELPVTTSFDDTEDANVLKLASLEIVGGIGNNKFDPDGEITREQAAKMLALTAEALELTAEDATSDFADAAVISDWAVEYVNTVATIGVMNGVSGGNFDPKGAYTREQSILTVLRLYKLTVDAPEVPEVPEDGAVEGTPDDAETPAE